MLDVLIEKMDLIITILVSGWTDQLTESCSHWFTVCSLNVLLSLPVPVCGLGPIPAASCRTDVCIKNTIMSVSLVYREYVSSVFVFQFSGSAMSTRLLACFSRTTDFFLWNL